jgi:ATP-dependent Clp protease adaptor protein ClpS
MPTPAKQPGWLARRMLKDVLDTAEPELRPGMSKVLMHNYYDLPMESAVDVLERIFGLSRKAATRVILRLHYRGIAHCGGFTAALASANVKEVAELARGNGYSLSCTTQQHPLDKE